MAAAAAMAGLTRWVRPPAPCRPSKLRLDVDAQCSPLPARIYANEGVAQMLFFQSDEVCETSYKDRGGKYQGQTGVTLPRT